MQSHGGVLATIFALSAACVSGGGPLPDRLYPPGPQPLGPQQVSTLAGYVQFVDDKDVSSLSGYFELLPGCHIIGTPSRMGVPTPGRTSVGTLTTGRWTFALPMRAGHEYRIENKDSGMMGPRGRFTIKAYESDLRGNKTREFEHAASPKDIEGCKEEAARFLPAPK
ncbi:MAG: hypothetical protein WCG85_04060 [Polyangia bacterium]